MPRMRANAKKGLLGSSLARTGKRGRRESWSKYGVDNSDVQPSLVAMLVEIMSSLDGDYGERATEMEVVLKIGTGRNPHGSREPGTSAKLYLNGKRPITPDLAKRALRYLENTKKEMPPAAKRCLEAITELQMARFRNKLNGFARLVSRETAKRLELANKTPDPAFARYLIGMVLIDSIPTNAHKKIVIPPRLKSY